jgi:cupin 2 domain-containing protein
MTISKGNIFSDAPAEKNLPESFEALVNCPELLIERIITNQSFQSPGQWYDQDKDEWLILLEGSAELEFENDEFISLNKGDYILIPSHKRHRVKSVSKSPSCIWLAVHANQK